MRGRGVRTLGPRSQSLECAVFAASSPVIRTALEFVQSSLDAFIVEREQDASYPKGSVDLKSIVHPNGTIDITDTSHVTIMLVGVDEERREGKRPQYIPTDGNQFLRLNAPVEIDLYLLFVASNKDYQTALRDLSDVLAFFQANPVFDATKFPALNATVTDPGKKPWQLITRLSFTLQSLTFEQLNNLWAMLGSKYIPSVVYRVKLLTIFETRSQEKAPAIVELGIR